MNKKILTIILSVLFVDLFLYLWLRPDYLLEFVPFIQFIGEAYYISAYDCFFIVSAVIIYNLYRQYNVSPKIVLRELFSIIRGLTKLTSDTALQIGAGVAMHFYGSPFLRRIFLDLLNNLRESPDSIRHVILVSIPFWWFLSIGLVNKYGSKNSLPPNQGMGGHQGMQMPSPPWNP